MTTSSTETTYTYDDKFNPLNRIPDVIFLFVEEHFIWEFALSKQNSLTRSHFTQFNMQTTHTTYTNEYNEYYRLVRKVDEEGNGFTFTYC